MSVALYNMIWAASLWQLLMEVWKVTQVFGENLFNQSAMKEVLGMLVLFGGSYFICINTEVSIHTIKIGNFCTCRK